MGDSDNSKILPSVTRRTLLTIAAGSLTARAARGEPATAQTAVTIAGPQDPALSLWTEWHATYQRACDLGRKQQRLESELVTTVGFPSVKLRIPGQHKPVVVETEAEIDRWLRSSPDTAMARVKARTRLAARREVWDDADERIGYSRTREAERDAQDEYDQLAETLWESPASSSAGVAAKLYAVLVIGEYREDCEEFPWPQIRSALADLLRIDGERAA